MGKICIYKKNHKVSWKKIENNYWTEFIKTLDLSIPVQELILFSKKFIKPVPGMINLLKNLKERGIDIIICSNNFEFWFERQKQVLNLGKILSLDKMVISCRYGVSKSDPSFTLLKEVEKRMMYPKKTYLIIDDSVALLQRATEFGLTGIFYPTAASFGSQYLQNIFNRLNM